MRRTARTTSPLPSDQQRVPPLPHPSWNRSLTGRAAGPGTIAPDEFWQRLGL